MTQDADTAMPYKALTLAHVEYYCIHIICFWHYLQKRELYATIASLEKDISSLKREIRERDETIGDKERRIYDLKKKNQVCCAKDWLIARVVFWLAACAILKQG